MIRYLHHGSLMGNSEEVYMLTTQKNIFKNGPLELDGDMLSLFDRAGFINKEYWVTNVPGTSIFMESLPSPSNIAHVPRNTDDSLYVDSYTGIHMYLLGTLTKEMVADAHVTETQIIFPQVLLNGGVCDIIVTA